MLQAEIELSEVKSIIRGLLISSIEAISIRQLEFDYQKLVGKSIPFISFGYPSTEDFLRAIPDAVNLKESAPGYPSNLLIVEPVQSDRSIHVEKMVKCQRNSRILHGMERCSAVPESKIPKRAGKNSSGLPEMATRFIPLDLRISLARVCQRYASSGLPLSLLGTELSHDLSTADWAEGGKNGWLNNYGFSCIEDLVDGLKDQGLVKITFRYGLKWVLSNNDSEKARHKTSEEMVNRRREIAPRISPDNGVVPAGLEYFPNEEWSDNEAEVLVSDRMKKNLRNILAKHPDGLWCAELPNEYKMYTGDELDMKQFGCVSIIQMASRLKDVFNYTRPGKNSDWLLFDSKSNSLWNCSAAPTGKGNQMTCLPSTYIQNFENLLMDHPDGIERAKFLKFYKAKYKEIFPLIDFGFENVKTLLGHLAQQNIVYLKFSGYIPMVCRPCSYSPRKNFLGRLKQDGDFINALYPEEAVGQNEIIPLQPLPEDLVPGCIFNIQVARVDSPSRFWFQIWESNLRDEFEIMMDEMEDFYNSDGVTEYKMPDKVIIIGHYCATRFPPVSYEYSEWHRAIITALPSLSEAEVFYIDYGNTLKIQRSELYFLKSQFSKLPIQALEARLANIRPVGYGSWKYLEHLPESDETNNVKPTWPKSCVNLLVDLIASKPTVAFVTHIRKSFLSSSHGLQP